MSDEKARPLNEFELSEMFDEINKEHFESKINKIDVVWNKRLRTCAGKCFYKSLRKNFDFGFASRNMMFYTPTKIELAYNVFKVNDWDKEKIYTTLAHEMTHAFLVQEYNERGHTQRFQDIMTRITGTRKNHRCHNYKTIKSKKSVDIICSKCGHIGTRTRMPKAGATYKHTGCGGEITFKKNNSGGSGFIKI